MQVVVNCTLYTVALGFPLHQNETTRDFPCGDTISIEILRIAHWKLILLEG